MPPVVSVSEMAVIWNSFSSAKYFLWDVAIKVVVRRLLLMCAIMGSYLCENTILDNKFEYVTKKVISKDVKKNLDNGIEFVTKKVIMKEVKKV